MAVQRRTLLLSGAGPGDLHPECLGAVGFSEAGRQSRHGFSRHLPRGWKKVSPLRQDLSGVPGAEGGECYDRCGSCAAETQLALFRSVHIVDREHPSLLQFEPPSARSNLSLSYFLLSFRFSGREKDKNFSVLIPAQKLFLKSTKKPPF